MKRERRVEEERETGGLRERGRGKEGILYLTHKEVEQGKAYVDATNKVKHGGIDTSDC